MGIDHELFDDTVLQIPFLWYRNGSSKVYYNPVDDYRVVIDLNNDIKERKLNILRFDLKNKILNDAETI